MRGLKGGAAVLGALSVLMAGAASSSTHEVPTVVAVEQVNAPTRFGVASPESTVVAVLGDSIVTAPGFSTELCRLMAASGEQCDVHNYAVAGTACSYWPSRINNILSTAQPDIVILMCGTNDAPWETIYGEPKTSWAWRATTEAVRAYGALPASGFIQYSDPLLAQSWVLSAQPVTNDRIYVEYMRCPSCYALIDWQSIPATATYLVGTPADPYGLHPTPRGLLYMARIAFDAIATKRGWPASTEPPLCDLYGHRRDEGAMNGYGRPPYTPC